MPEQLSIPERFVPQRCERCGDTMVRHGDKENQFICMGHPQHLRPPVQMTTVVRVVAKDMAGCAYLVRSPGSSEVFRFPSTVLQWGEIPEDAARRVLWEEAKLRCVDEKCELFGFFPQAMSGEMICGILTTSIAGAYPTSVPDSPTIERKAVSFRAFDHTEFLERPGDNDVLKAAKRHLHQR
ncbi:MAG: NUDIX hydrolase [Methylococcaceae bacterium]